MTRYAALHSFHAEPSGGGEVKLTELDGISERLVGWGCMAATATEYIRPDLLSLDLSQAAGLGVFGFLVATGRAEAVVRRIGRMLSDG